MDVYREGALVMGIAGGSVLLYAIYTAYRLRDEIDFGHSLKRYFPVLILAGFFACSILFAYSLIIKSNVPGELFAGGMFFGGAGLALLVLKVASSSAQRQQLHNRERDELDELLMRVKKDWEETFDIINDTISIHDRKFRIIRANKAALDYLDSSFEKLIGEKCFRMYHGLESPPKDCPGCQAMGEGAPVVSEVFEPHFDKYIEIKALPRVNLDGAVHGVVCVLRDITARKRMEREREDLIHQLEEALAKIKTLKGLIPMCAWCKKVRDDHGYWKKVEEYIEKHSDATFTHGICPDCITKEEESYAKANEVPSKRKEKAPPYVEAKEPKDIKVMFDDDSIEMVSSSQLQKLICMDLVKQFRRSDGWVSIGTDPIRGMGGTYDGQDRRRTFTGA